MQISSAGTNFNGYGKENVAKKMGFKGELKDIYKDEVYGMKSGDFLRLNFQERAKAGSRKTYALTGYTRGDEPKVSIIGKLKGYDPSFTSEQITELKNFINDSKSLGIDFIWKIGLDDKIELPDGKEYFLVDSFIQNYSSSESVMGDLEKNSKTVELLDSDLSIDEFKAEWAKHTLKERFNLNLSDKDAKNAVEILKQLQNQAMQEKEPNQSDEKFKPIQGFSKSQTYKDEATNELKELFKFIEREFNSGKSVFSILEAVVRSRKDILV